VFVDYIDRGRYITVGAINVLPAVVDRIESGMLWLYWQGCRLAAAPLPFETRIPGDFGVRPSQILIIRPDRLSARKRENLLEVEVEIKSAEFLTVELRRQNPHVMHRRDTAASMT
jgi:hypothetical protein